MIFTPTTIPGCVLVDPEPRADARGFFARLFCPEEFAAAGHPFTRVQASLSRNPTRHTLRGLHWQDPPHAESKLVHVTRGRVHDVVVDLRPDSPAYRRWLAFDLDAENARALLVPAGCAHGFLTLEPDTDVLYEIDRAYVPGVARGARYDDPAFGIDWPAPPALVGAADLAWPAWG